MKAKITLEIIFFILSFVYCELCYIIGSVFM